MTLRPGWPEDARALSEAIGHEAVVSKLSRAPWPYALGDAEAFLARPRGSAQPDFLIVAREGDGAEIVGGIGIERRDDGAHELGYWLTPAAWGRGYATEAGRQMIEIARSLGLKRLHSGHFVDNPASGRVLAKLGFRQIGIEPRHSAARGGEAPCALFELALDEEASTDDPVRMAA
ncbi:N-acetyltransferase [Sphingomonas koreensis]|nr:N-acetyltransferase [Sphingomonas koreensis]